MVPLVLLRFCGFGWVTTPHPAHNGAPCRHFNFFSRYRPLPEAVYGPLSLQQPLLSTRWESVACTELGETLEDLPPLERLLRCEHEAAFGPIAEALWESSSDAEAAVGLVGLARGSLAQWEEELRAGGGERREESQQVEG